uniref:Uncharacterized protein n=1 Tax=uncultured marine virus TaxID=186617 RepID=A0A0F7L7N0_9VIRU|nr:hypothetical protein [uncultured marine virus]
MLHTKSFVNQPIPNPNPKITNTIIKSTTMKQLSPSLNRFVTAVIASVAVSKT